MRVFIVVEQPGGEPNRMRFLPEENRFIKTEHLSLGYARGFRGVYGWVQGHGQPPRPHKDVFLITEEDCEPGSILEGKLVGCFLREDGDHKLVCIAPNRPEEDLEQLPGEELAMVKALYPRVGAAEGWFGEDRAIALLAESFCR